MPKTVRIVEVGPRDGLQNEKKFLPTKEKINLINQLSQTGLKYIEVTSFVSAKIIPQLADNEIVYKKIAKQNGVNFSALVPNEKGMLTAVRAGVREIAIFTAVSETFTNRNIHCSIAESLDRFLPVIEIAKIHSIKIRAYISCAFGCPYEGSITANKVALLAQKLLQMQATEICLGDTIGVATPKQVNEIVAETLTVLPKEKLALHFHDTYGQALANIYAALTLGIQIFDSSIAGLGGCPYAQGATGNVATEDVLYLMQGLGINTGIDIFKIALIGDNICKKLKKKNQSKVANALLANK